jgi:hypothetical protein
MQNETPPESTEPKVAVREKPKYLTEAIAEARQLLNQGFMVDETVVRALLRGVAEGYGEAYEPVHRYSLNKPAVFDHDKMIRL